MAPQVSKSEVFPVLKGKVAIITGGAQGMGKATVEVFLQAGAKVVLCDIQEDKGTSVVEELSSLGEISFLKTDISSSEQVAALVKFAVDKYGRLDCAVNNAALSPDKTPLIDFDEDYWTRIVNVNLTGTALCVKHQMKQFIAQGGGGSIVNIASINAFSPQPNMPAYTSAKHALVGLTKHASMEGGPHNIRVNAVAPGAIFSDMSEAALKIMGITHDEFAHHVSFLNRFGIPHEVAQGSLWLCSPASSYVTGITMPVDGGFTAK
ncbi:3-oxoacyl-[acyl-carrier protein] reductase [Geosmithia morbida]|uniref:3-oxoacyl-[acyl-carrier protein] reductase n=1 Tax=Geosmithia morbida TaxID=1094350 RepID=A0A9P4YNX0_9HYPO|nr:3-oxoacyl-[acyl-carrier protein] reductase [Geosmithia morbida]KAF4120426.1 3-oxoacyl-[acyl-carrier protein] reductase [Geosmithia morbida]